MATCTPWHVTRCSSTPAAAAEGWAGQAVLMQGRKASWRFLLFTWVPSFLVTSAGRQTGS